MLDRAENSSAAAECFVEVDSTSKREKSKNKRRFSDDQIRSLELMFESDTKLESRKKAQLAKELGLQPRQISIWFQNKRARWKSKQIEKDYSFLSANYNILASQFDSLKKENHSLLLQLEKLKNEKKKHCQNEETAAGHSSSDGESDYKKIDFEVKNIGSKPLEGVISEDESSIKAEEILVVDEENELLKMVEPAVDSSLTSSDDLINQPSEISQWWDFWC